MLMICLGSTRQGRKESKLMDDKLELLAKPLMEYLEKNHHPYTAIIVTNERVEVVETVIAIPKTDMN